MDAEIIKEGADLVEKVLLFNVWCYGETTAGDARKAIQTLFGPEVDAEVQRRFLTPI